MTIRAEYTPLSEMITNATGFGVCGVSSLQVFTDGLTKLEQLEQDIRAAKKKIQIAYFHFGIDKRTRHIRRLLMQRAKEGVRVEFLYEDIANFPIFPHYFWNMRFAGVKVRRFSPHPFNIAAWLKSINHRNHRKIVVIDDTIGYSGGMNLTQNYYGAWRDTHLRMTGGIVEQLQHVFEDDWNKNTPKRGHTPAFRSEDIYPAQLLPCGRTIQPRLLPRVYCTMLNNAQQYVWLQTPYFAPTDDVLNAIKQSAKRGVDVRLMLPRVPDNKLTRWINKSYYDELLDAGVKIYLHEPFIHAKTSVVDDYLTSIGSANLDGRGLTLDYEVNTLLYSEEIAGKQKSLFLDDMQHCTQLTPDEWSKQKRNKTMERLSRTFSRLL